MTQLLARNQVEEELKKTPNWTLNKKGEITTTFTLKSFAHALLFSNSIGIIAETMNHHPDILIQFNKVILSVSTHDAGGLTEKDLLLALKINSIPLPQ